ncbi:UNVERIFIED_CONTAM: hypothetical protein Cloal_0924 [Acetivibrio alkalicellulosi]
MIMKNVLVIVLLIFIMMGCSLGSAESVKVIRFYEDELTSQINIKGYQIVSYNIKDTIPDNGQNIWVSYDFIKDKDYIMHLKEYLIDGRNIIIEGDLTNTELYKIFDIPEESRTYGDVASVPLDLNQSDPQLFRGGTLLYKYKDSFYPTSMNFAKEAFENNPERFYSGLFEMYKIDKEKKYEQGPKYNEG